ncbi:hypothetical protein [uncultured Erythrobacter sp.]|uniref:hypothetical protein n=1 Tax=uncultured Erythrobacter sp. TaxID=263913 RepID=UPI0026164E30|nr:hypothetical protein [uncultured Erythrobacter sp.]
MPALDRSYVSDCAIEPGGSVAFTCSTDSGEWPWLALPAQHPLVIQTQNFWCSVGATQAARTRDDSKWSALTWTDWVLGDRDAGMAVRGVFERTGEGDKLDFCTRLFDAQDRLITRIRGKGVVFRTRNFESWRGKSKADVRSSAPDHSTFTYAPREALGLPEAEPPLLAPLEEVGGTLRSAALVTRENGLMPGHPYFSGSGDHVNAPHLAEIGRQAAYLVSEGEARTIAHTITGAEMDMHRYIELGTRIDIAIERPSASSVELTVSQLERSCAKIAMEWG